MASTIIFGLVFSTITALIIVPSIYGLFFDNPRAEARFKKRLAVQKEIDEATDEATDEPTDESQHRDHGGNGSSGGNGSGSRKRSDAVVETYGEKK
jgi:hypothetical protein